MLPVAMMVSAKAGTPPPQIIEPAPAPAVGGWYLGVSGGAAFLQEISVDGVDIQSDVGWSAIATLGYNFGNGFAVELESGYAETEFDKISFGGFDRGLGGDYKQIPIILSGVFNGRINDVLSVYIAGGAGAVWSESSIDGWGGGRGGRISVTDDNWAFVLQAKAGVRWDINDVVALNVGYRGLYGFDAFDSRLQNGPDDAITHIAELGVTFKF